MKRRLTVVALLIVLLLAVLYFVFPASLFEKIFVY